MSIRLSTTLGTLASVAVGSVVLSGPAAAHEPEGIVDLFGCAFSGGGTSGTTTVDAGLVDVFAGAWITGPRGASIHFVKSQTTTFIVQYDGEAPTTEDFSDAWTEPEPVELDFSGKAWVTELMVPLGELEAGQTVTITFNTTLKTPIVDFFKIDPPFEPMHAKAGTLVEGTCEITVV